MTRKISGTEQLARLLSRSLELAAVADSLAATDDDGVTAAQTAHDVAQAALAAGDWQALASYLAGARRRVQAVCEATAVDVTARLEQAINADNMPA